MVRIIDYQATEPVSRVGQIRPILIPHSPRKVVLATIRITIPRRNAKNNHVELIATVGVRGVTGTSQILFKIFRDGREIFRAQEGVESDPTSEVNYVVTVQGIDTNVGAGTHTYQVTAENITDGTEAAVVGPISFSGLAIAPTDEDRDSDRDMDRVTSQDRDQDMDRVTSRDRDRDMDRVTSRRRVTSRDRDRDMDRVTSHRRVTSRDRDRDMDRVTSHRRITSRDRDRDMDRTTSRHRDRDRDRDRTTSRNKNREQDRRPRSPFDDFFRRF